MSWENYFYWKNWEDYVGPVDDRGYARFIECGMAVVQEPGVNTQKYIPLFEDIGVPYEVWGLGKIRQRLPLFDLHTHFPPRTVDDETFGETPTESIDGVLFKPNAGYVNDPQLATHNLMLAAQSQGGAFLFDAEVSGIQRQNGRVAGVTLKTGETLDAPVVVNVAGPHSFVINRLAGVETGMNIKTKALRHEVHHVPSPPDFDYEKEGVVASDSGCGIYFRPEAGNNILVGSDDPTCDERVWLDNPDEYKRNLTAHQWKNQVYRLAQRIPELPIPSTPRGLVDLYDVSDDWIPIYDKSDLPGFYMAIGTSGNQFKNAGGVGHLMAELINACENGREHDNEPVQVKMPYTGLVLDTSFYSRRREINRNSSFSVLG
jgi:sarcosine oxidase subunit beta